MEFTLVNSFNWGDIQKFAYALTRYETNRDTGDFEYSSTTIHSTCTCQWMDSASTRLSHSHHSVSFIGATSTIAYKWFNFEYECTLIRVRIRLHRFDPWTIGVGVGVIECDDLAPSYHQCILAEWRSSVGCQTESFKGVVSLAPVNRWIRHQLRIKLRWFIINTVIDSNCPYDHIYCALINHRWAFLSDLLSLTRTVSWWRTSLRSTVLYISTKLSTDRWRDPTVEEVHCYIQVSKANYPSTRNVQQMFQFQMSYKFNQANVKFHLHVDVVWNKYRTSCMAYKRLRQRRIEFTQKPSQFLSI